MSLRSGEVIVDLVGLAPDADGGEVCLVELLTQGRISALVRRGGICLTGGDDLVEVPARLAEMVFQVVEPR